MKSVINVYKPIGKTPLEVVEQFRQLYPKVRDKKIAYAGRLDPLAHGVLLLLIEPETKHRSRYQNLGKSYEFDLVLGIETDTHDLMGFLKSNKINSTPKDVKNNILSVVSNLTGIQQQFYPIFSSKTIHGKPLYWWAREGKIDKIKIPSKNITIHSFELVKIYEKPVEELNIKAIQRIRLVSGDFRQEQIIDKWSQLASRNKNASLICVELKLTCSSGTYVRELAKSIGNELKVGGLCADILRTKVGDYDIRDSLRLQFTS